MSEFDNDLECDEPVPRHELENNVEDKKIAEDLYNEILSPPVNDEGNMGKADGVAWIERINEKIRTRLDFYSLCELMVMAQEDAASRKSFVMTQARHFDNRAMKANIFIWLDANMPKFKSMDAAAQAVTKQEPIVFRTARDWVGEWKKLRSTGTP